MKTTKKATTKKAEARLVDDPIAITSGGQLLLNTMHLDGMADPVAAIRRLLDDGHRVFVGIAVPKQLRREVLRDIDDAAADVVGRLGLRLRRRPR